MATRAPTTADATTVRIPEYDRDDDRRYSLEAVYESLATFIRRRHGRTAERQYRKAMNEVFNAVRNDHYEYVKGVLEARITLEIQEYIRDLRAVATTYSVPIRR